MTESLYGYFFKCTQEPSAPVFETVDLWSRLDRSEEK